MTRFWLVRHGPTHAKTMVGWTDLPADLSARLRPHGSAAFEVELDLIVQSPGAPN